MNKQSRKAILVFLLSLLWVSVVTIVAMAQDSSGQIFLPTVSRFGSNDPSQPTLTPTDCLQT